MAGVHRADLELLVLGSAVAVAELFVVVRRVLLRDVPWSAAIARFSLSRSDINMDRI